MTLYSFVVVTFFFAIPDAAVIGIFALVFGRATLTIIIMCHQSQKKKTFSLMPGGMYCPIGFCV
jgi:hypothetical protein